MFHLVLAYSKARLSTNASDMLEAAPLCTGVKAPVCEQGLMSALTIKENSLIIYPVGTMDNQNSENFREMVKALFLGNYNSFAIDLSGLVSLDRAGAAALEEIRKIALSFGVRLSIINPNPALIEAMAAQGLCRFSKTQKFGYAISPN